jgi:prepilin-type N-terminal cleavage/methylation domain-containing protein
LILVERIGPGRRSAFTLLESLVALALISVGLLLAVGIQMQQPRTLERLRARQEATRALEATLESIRAGVVPLADGVVPVSAVGGSSRALTLRLRVAATPTADLWQVECEASYVVLGRLERASLTSLVWAPP